MNWLFSLLHWLGVSGFYARTLFARRGAAATKRRGGLEKATKNRRSNKLKSLAPASDAQPVVIILLFCRFPPPTPLRYHHRFVVTFFTMQLGVRQSRVGKSVSCAMETRMKLLIFASFVTMPPKRTSMAPTPPPHLSLCHCLPDG